jgi:hypothetical protein
VCAGQQVEVKKAEVREGLIDADPMASAFAALDKWKKPQVSGSTGVLIRLLGCHDEGARRVGS